MVFLRKISDLGAERNKLADGMPCPLCGSIEHPYAQGNVPEMDKTEKKINSLTELINKADTMENSINLLEIKEKRIADKLAEAEKHTTKAVHEKENAEKNLKRLTDELTGFTERFVKLKTAALSQLQPFGFNDIAEDKVTCILDSLNDRLKKWQNKQRKKEKIEKQISDLNAKIRELDAVIDTHSQSLSDKQKALDLLKKEYTDQITRRCELFGSKKPDSEEARLETLISDAQQAEKDARNEYDKAKQQLNSVNIRINSLKDTIAKRTPELKVLETDFIISLNKAGFTDEQAFILAQLSADERNKLNARARQLDNKQAEIQALKNDRQERLNYELNKKITEHSLKELTPSQKELEESLKKLRDEIGGLNQKLNDNNTAKNKIKEQQALIDAQQKEYSRWDRLHALIGSADGKKYRNFAQGLTFELMVSHANRQLAKMTDRYLLIRDKKEPLEINVIDNYQDDEIRSTKNLSGGESFIVSLSLALGLSKMASRRVRVDSLFLDEGFGTLDEDALDTALNTLAGLQQDEKLIGIISHVAALKERISTQINISPISGGKSAITGPGVQVT